MRKRRPALPPIQVRAMLSASRELTSLGVLSALLVSELRRGQARLPLLGSFLGSLLGISPLAICEMLRTKSRLLQSLVRHCVSCANVDNKGTLPTASAPVNNRLLQVYPLLPLLDLRLERWMFFKINIACHLTCQLDQCSVLECGETKLHHATLVGAIDLSRTAHL